MAYIQFTLYIGTLVHFDSVALKDLYFVDSQWLCDMFAHVVSLEYNCEELHMCIISCGVICFAVYLHVDLTFVLSQFCLWWKS